MSRRLQRTIQSLFAMEDVVPYVASFSMPAGFSFPPEFRVSQFKGLLFCVLITASSESRVLTYWRDHEHLLARSTALQLALGLRKPELIGEATEFRVRTQPLWKRYRLGTWLLAAAAVLGALSAMRDYYGVLFAAPEVSLLPTDSGRLDIIEGNQFTIPLQATSDVRFAPSKIRILSAVLEPKGNGASVPIQLDNRTVPNLAPGATATFRASGTAPDHSRGNGSPDVYRFVASGSAKTGLLRLSVPLRTEREVWNWVSKNRVGLSTWAPVGDMKQGCRLESTIYTPAAHASGVSVEIVLSTKIGLLTSLYVTATGANVPAPMTVQDDTMETDKVEFRTPPLEVFGQYSMKCYFKTVSRPTRRECLDIAAAISTSVTQ